MLPIMSAIIILFTDTLKNVLVCPKDYPEFFIQDIILPLICPPNPTMLSLDFVYGCSNPVCYILLDSISSYTVLIKFPNLESVNNVSKFDLTPV